MWVFTCRLTDHNTTQFTLKLYHGGHIVFDGRLKTNKGGEVSYIDNCDLDKMSLLELNDILKRVLKYCHGGRYNAKWKGNNDLLLMCTDSLMMKFFSQQFHKCKLVEVWVEHPISVFVEVNKEGVGVENEKSVSEEAEETICEEIEDGVGEKSDEPVGQESDKAVDEEGDEPSTWREQDLFCRCWSG